MVFGTNSRRILHIEDLSIEDYFLKTYLLVGDHLLSSIAESDEPSLIFNGNSCSIIGLRPLLSNLTPVICCFSVKCQGFG